MRFGRGIVLLMALVAPVVIWTEAFPKAHGQTEAELLASPFAHLQVPEGVRTLSVEYRQPLYLQAGLLGGTPQLVCAKLIQTFEVRRAGALREVFVQTALMLGKSRDEAESATRGDPPPPMSVGMTSIRYQEGDARAWVFITDLPEPFGGRCTAGRLGIYQTVVNY